MVTPKERAVHIVDYLSIQGYLSIPVMISDDVKSQLIGDIEQLIDNDYIPGKGKHIGFGGKEDMLNIRNADPGLRCSVKTGEDIQSSPFYCGAPATKMADSKDKPGMIYVTCKQHEEAMK